MIFQIVLVAFVLWFVVRVYRQYRTRQVHLGWFIYCLLFAATVAVVALNPELTNMAARLVGVGRGADLVIYSSLVILFVGFFFQTVHLHRVERELTELVRKIAIENPNSRNPGSNKESGGPG